METGSNEVTEQKDRTVVNYSPTQSRRALSLFVVDNILSTAVIGPLVVFYWRGLWELFNVYLFPDNQAASGWTCFAIGNIGSLCIVYLQKPLARWIHVDNAVHWILGYHMYTYVLGGLNVCHWRGVWVLLDHYSGVNVLSSWITFAIGQIGLWILRSSRNACAPPNVTVFDRNADLFAYSTRFNTQANKSELYMYLLDTLLTVCIIHQLVVFYWRGVWEIFDVHLLPEDSHTSALICLLIACTVQLLVCLIEVAANCFCQTNRSKIIKWALEVVIFFFANLVAVTLWRGIWILLNYHFVPDNRGFSAGMTHLIGIVVLWVMLCAHSVTVSGCQIDGESPVEEACLTPNYYLRLFFMKQHRNQVAAVGEPNELGRVTDSVVAHSLRNIDSDDA